MNSTVSRSAASLFLLLTALAGCGGGGGGGGDDDDGGGSGGVTTYPSSGAYGWVLKASGPTEAQKLGLSLVHPSQSDTEYVIEVENLNGSDAQLLSSGSVDTGALRATSLQPHSLVYIVGGDVRVIPMQANGTAPLTRRQRSDTRSACRFVIAAPDYAAPLNSRYVVSTAGLDALCNTADDGRAEVRFSSAGAPILTSIAGDAPLDALRDPSTLAPRGWLFPRSASLWTTSPATAVELRTLGSPAISRAVASTYRQSLVEDGTQLGVITFSGGSSFTETPLDAATTAGSGWQSIGYDANNFYVRRNAGTTFDSTWTVLRISRTAPAATVMATGTGLIILSSMGTDVLYLSVSGRADNRLVRIAKTGGAPAETVNATSTFTSVQTSASGVHQLWRVTDVGTPAAVYTIEMISESGAIPLFTRAGGWPLYIAEASTQNFNSSESRNRFLFAGGFTANRAFNGATLETYDAATTTARVLGALPGSSDFGTNFGFANAIGGPSGIGTAFAAPSVDGSLIKTGARVYSYDLGSANSLKATTKTE